MSDGEHGWVYSPYSDCGDNQVSLAPGCLAARRVAQHLMALCTFLLCLQLLLGEEAHGEPGAENSPAEMGLRIHLRHKEQVLALV